MPGKELDGRIEQRGASSPPANNSDRLVRENGIGSSLPSGDRQDSLSLDKFLTTIRDKGGKIELPCTNDQGDCFAVDEQQRIIAFRYNGYKHPYRIHYDVNNRLDCIVVPGRDGLIWQRTNPSSSWIGSHKNPANPEGMMKLALNVTIDQNGIHPQDYIDKNDIHSKNYFDWQTLNLPLKENPSAIEKHGNLFAKDNFGHIYQFQYESDRRKNLTYKIEFNQAYNLVQKITLPHGGRIEWQAEDGIWKQYHANDEPTDNQWHNITVDEYGIHYNSHTHWIHKPRHHKSGS